jgi:anti-sigma-K factor RskA
VTDHEAIEELLAGYALGALSGPDAEDTDRLLVEHVPGCADCRATLTAFDRVAADLGLDADPVAPPETLLPRMRRELRTYDQGSGTRWSTGRLAAVAASLVVVVVLGGLALTRGGGTDVTTLAASNDIQQALEAAGRPDAETTQIGPMTEVDASGLAEVYVYGQDVPLPPPGTTYRLWAVSDEETAYLGDFLPPPTGGRMMLEVTVDRTRYDRLLVTVEPLGSTPSEPGEPAWDAA